jgi:hypothetical protein
MPKSKPHDGKEGDGRVRVDKDGRERVVHIEIAARRFAGGTPPSPEAYARAVKQWRQLDGALAYVPVDDLAKAPDTVLPTDVDASAQPGKSRRRGEEY